MRRKSWIAVLLTFCMIIGMAGCSKGSAEDKAEDKAEGTGDTGSIQDDITWIRFAGTMADSQKSILKDYPNGKAAIDDIDYLSVQSKEILAFTAKESEYDVVQVNQDWCKEYAAEGYLMPLDDFIADAGLDLGRYNQGLLEAYTYDGKLYALPEFAQCYFFVFNSDWLEQDGFEVPENWDEFFELCDYYKKNGSGIAIPGYLSTYANEMFATFLYSYGGSWFDEETGELTVDTEAGHKAAALWEKLFTYAADGYVAWSVDDACQLTREGSVPIGLGISGLACDDLDPEKSVIADCVEYRNFYFDDLHVCVSAYGVSIPNNCKNPEGSYRFCEWLTSEETENREALESGSISGRTDEVSAEVDEKYPYIAIAQEAMSNPCFVLNSGKGLDVMEDLHVLLQKVHLEEGYTGEDLVREISEKYAGIDLR